MGEEVGSNILYRGEAISDQTNFDRVSKFGHKYILWRKVQEPTSLKVQNNLIKGEYEIMQKKQHQACRKLFAILVKQQQFQDSY